MDVFQGEVDRLVVRDAAAQLLRDAIVDGRLGPGEHLKGEKLAKALGISRTPVREALVILEAEGLVEATTNRGATVRSYNHRELDDIFRLRAVLEGYGARRAAERIDDNALAALWESCDRYEDRIAERDLPGLVRENYVFHDLILDVADNDQLSEFVRQVIAMPFMYYGQFTSSVSAHYHRQLVNALAARDSERAELIMKEHILESRDVVVNHVEQLLSDRAVSTAEGRRLIIQSDRVRPTSADP